MLGSVIGDICGSIHEYASTKTKRIKFFDESCSITDDGLMTMAVFCALEKCNGNYNNLSDITAKEIVKWYKRYPNPTGAYGSSFEGWCERCIKTGKIQAPYNSFGNGAAMRVSSVAYFAKDLDHCKELSKKVTQITHNHPEGIKGAEAVSVAIYLALNGKTRTEIFEYINTNYYKLEKTCNEIREEYVFDPSCQGSVPQSLQSFFESVGFADSIKIAISLGGDADTMAAITGAISEAYFGIVNMHEEEVFNYLDEHCLSVAKRMIEKRNSVRKSYLMSDGKMVKDGFSFPRSCGSDMDNFPLATTRNFRFKFEDVFYSDYQERLKIIDGNKRRKMTNFEFMFYVDEIKLFLNRRYKNKLNVEEFYGNAFEELSVEFYGKI